MTDDDAPREPEGPGSRVPDAPATTPNGGQVPLLIFAPGFVKGAANSGTRVAQLIAANASLLPGTYKAVESDAQAGVGLRVCSTVVGPAGAPVLEVWELDYHSRLDDDDLIGGPRGTPGYLRTSLLAVRGLWMWWRACRRPAKSTRAKVQLVWGFGLLSVLLLLAIAAVLAALRSIGIGEGVLSELEAARFAVLGGITVAGVWAFLKPRFSVGAARIERVMDFADRYRYRAAVVRTVWEALDGLRDRQWTGPLHLAGFSFGTLVLLDALFPQQEPDEDVGANANLRELAEMVSSLTTIGCPADFVRLYWPEWDADRQPLRPEMYWLNILNASDVFGSNFQDEYDGLAPATRPVRPRRSPKAQARAEARAKVKEERAAKRRQRRERRHPVVPRVMVPNRSAVYQRKRSWVTVLTMGDFTVHGEYWGAPAADSCFRRESLQRLWFFNEVPEPGPARQ